MSAFDAELYLRLLGERLLLGSEPRHHHRSPLDLTAAALVAAETIDSDLALRVIDDYDVAAAARSGERGFRHTGPRRARRVPGSLEPRHTVVFNHEMTFGDGRLLVRDLAIGDASTTLRFRWLAGGTVSRHGHGFGSGHRTFPWGRRAPDIVDDAGHRPTVSPGNGGGGSDRWEGELHLNGPLSPALRWLEVEGTRIPVRDDVTPTTITIRRLAPADPIERFLDRRLAALEMPFGHPIELGPAIDALGAAGALRGREQLAAELERVSARLPGRHGGPRSAGSAGAGPIPAAWKSLLVRLGRDDGPSWTHVLGALTPRFDGVQVAIREVRSDDGGLDVDFEVAPNVLHATALDELPVVWSARDDRGNRHLGAPVQWGGGDDSAAGTMRFWPALDPKAARLELIVTADEHEAVIAFEVGERPA